MTTLGKKGKAHKGASKDKAAPTNPTPPRPSKHTIQCALCDVAGDATHACPELPHLKSMVNEMFPESDIPEVYVTILDLVPKLKSLCTNHPFTLCDFHGHYTHLCPCLEEYRSSLEDILLFKAKRNESTTPLFAHFSLAKPEDTNAPIDIPPPDVEMTEPSPTIFYLSSSMRPSVEVTLETSPDVSLDIPSAITLGSTSVDPLSDYSSVNI